MSDVALAREQAPETAALPRPAARLLAVLALSAAAAGASLALAYPSEVDWTLLAFVLGAACVAQARAIHAPGDQVFHTGLAFAVAAAIVLEPAGLLLVCLAQHVPDWVRHRHPWYVQTFNVANYVLSGCAAWGAHHALLPAAEGGAQPPRVLAAVVAGAVFVLVNHVVLTGMLRVAREQSLRATGLLSFDGVVTDLVVAATGVVIALLVDDNPWAAPVAVVPLVLIHRSLRIPVLREEALRDPKTQLLNHRGLDEAARRELARCERFDRPLSVLLVDVDGLREINNRHGHLAGDAALKEVAAALLESRREYDVCARFGGDEFLILLPETSADQAAAVQARVDAQIGRRTITLVSGEALPIRASVGTATLAPEDKGIRDLIRRADHAMYAAKRRPDAMRAPRSSV